MLGKKYDAQRCRNIGAARIIHLTCEDLEKLKKLLEFGMPDGYVMEKTGLSSRVYHRHKKLLYPNGIPWQIKWLENDVDMSVVEEVIRLTKLKYRYKRIAGLVGLGIKTVRLILNALNKRDPDIRIYSYDETSWSERKESGPERIIREWFTQKGIEHRQEVQLEVGSKWFFDFQVSNTNLLVEVQGDYWHCNPRLYSAPINNYQMWARRRDFAKRDYAKNLGYYVLAVWEYDLKSNKDDVFSSIERVIERCKLEQ